MIHYGGLPTVLAYLLLIPAALVIGIFPGLFALLWRWRFGDGAMAVLLAPVFWTALEWVRSGGNRPALERDGLLAGLSSFLIQAATWGGVYAVSFLILAINSAIALALRQANHCGP